MKSVLIGSLLSLICSVSFAQTVTIGPNSAYLRWSIPTTATDGSKLTNLAGFYIYYGSSPSSLTNIVLIPNPAQSAYMVNNLASGTWYFAQTSYTAQGTQSAPSNVVSKTIPAPVTIVPTVIPNPPTGVNLTAQ